MIEVLQIIATSWPIALMVIFLSAAFLLNRRWARYQEDQAAIYNLRASNSVVVRNTDDAG